MKPVFWQKVMPINVAGSVWDSHVNPDLTKTIDVTHLEKYFAEPPKKNKKKGGEGPPKKKKPEIQSVLDSKRTQSLGIFCQRSKMSDEEIVQKVLSCDECFMNPDGIEGLVSMYLLYII